MPLQQKQADNSGDIFRVLSVHLLTCGTKVIENKRYLPDGHQGVPDKVTFQEAVGAGHAVWRNDNGVAFDRTSDHGEFTDALRQVLPHPFAYFDRLLDEHDSDAEGSERKSSRPAWYLAAVANKQLRVVPVSRPTGAHADFNKGANTSSFRQCRLFLVSRKPVPLDVVASWADPAATGDCSDTTNSDADRGSESSSSRSPQPVRRKSKRRMNDQDDDGHAKKKRKSVSSSGNDDSLLPDILKDEIANEINHDLVIDLTEADDTIYSSGATTPPAPSNPMNPAFSDGVDSTLGDPYAANQTYDF
ncbi:hypothetical protein B0H16DRAFT_1737555 [Mycena metata]|uniref:Uncharacterized protein n=1 Tax=Mycena metata TaxID=1033252 RepID=A0AAD7MLA0_9AGAR|nr:hypothetical protein B0H16DRAFT_1737555 [Mycena metata]